MDISGDGFEPIDDVVAPDLDEIAVPTLEAPPVEDPEPAEGTQPADGLVWIDAGNGASYATVDLDGDGVLEAMIVDVNGDGVPDILVERLEGGYRQSVDIDQDGVFEDVQQFTDEEMAAYDPAIVEIMSGVGGDVVDEPVANPEVDDGAIIGDPFAYGDDWFRQSFNGSCLPAAVAQIYSEYTGTAVSDEGFVELVNALGLWSVDPSGTPGISAPGAETLLDSVGIPAEYLQDQTLEDLIAYLSEPPHAVMVSVDADTIWQGEAADRPDHAVLITGIDLEAGVVYLSDSGIEGGNMSAVDLDLFMEAWSSGGNELVVVEVSAEEYRSTIDFQEAATQLVESAPRDSAESAGAPAQDADAVQPDGLGGTAGTFLPGPDVPRNDPIADPNASPDFAGTEVTAGAIPEAGPLAVVGRWVSTHPWVLVPVTIGASAVIQGAISTAATARRKA